VPQVRCINADGEMVGIIPTQQAQRMAQEQGLDLVEISPTAEPPVCRIMDFGKYRYQENLKEKEARKNQHKQVIKEMKFHPNVGEHDYETKLNHIKDFLEKGFKVKLSLAFRGRENAHREIGFELFNRVIKDTAEIGVVEMTPRMMGRTILAMLGARPTKR
jgi:translation initiation factor IF-3